MAEMQSWDKKKRKLWEKKQSTLKDLERKDWKAETKGMRKVYGKAVVRHFKNNERDQRKDQRDLLDDEEDSDNIEDEDLLNDEDDEGDEDYEGDEYEDDEDYEDEVDVKKGKNTNVHVFLILSNTYFTSEYSNSHIVTHV